MFVGSIMASETTAAATGAVGVVRRDPMAMLPFCGYHMGDYLAALAGDGREAGRQGSRRSSTSTGSVLDDEGNFMWPGFGDNFRVLEWILKRCFDEVDAQETRHRLRAQCPPTSIWRAPTSLWRPSPVILGVDKDLWMEDVTNIEEFYKDFGDKLPPALREELETLKKNLQ